MNPTSFDQVTAGLAGRLTRRATLRAGVTGAAGLAAVAAFRGAAAQDATPASTPAASPVASPAADAPAPVLFVQSFGGGTWTPISEDPTGFVLALTEVSDATVVVSDQPTTVATTAPTWESLEQIGFTPEDGPNAALVVQATGGERVIAVQLLDPLYDSAGKTLVYTARLLEEAPAGPLALLGQRQQEAGDEDFPEEFESGTLFIDASALGG